MRSFLCWLFGHAYREVNDEDVCRRCGKKLKWIAMGGRDGE